MEKISIPVTKKGYPAQWVGGGATSQRWHARLVVTSQGTLPPAIFIRRAGSLAGSLEQALVRLKEGDLILEAGGKFPLVPDNPDIWVTGVRVVHIFPPQPGAEETEAEAFRLSSEQAEAAFWTAVSGHSELKAAISKYHNRDGGPFTGR